MTTTDSLPFNGELNRDAAGLPVYAVGTVEFWSQPVHEMYPQHPFKAFWAKLILNARHADSPAVQAELDQGIANEADYDLKKPGCQRAAGLYKGLDLGIFIPVVPSYDGDKPRQIYEPDRIRARGVVSHETGHFHDDMCGAWTNRDDVTRLITARFLELRPGQGQNEVEDWAEVFRAVMGTNDTRGTYSDGNPANISPELRALMRCGYWLAESLRGRWVCSLVPKPGGVMYQTFIGLGWRWRWISDADWHSEEHNGSTWVKI